MVTFVTLFLGLVTSVHPVEIAAGGEVAAVEVRLDGRRIGVVTGEPWVLDCDFGSDLAPHELVAVGYDGRGQELGRARQWINLPRSRAEITLALEPAPGGGQVARIIWQAVERQSQVQLAVTLDGDLLPATSVDRFPIPRFDPSRLHVLAAEATFADGLTRRAELGLGGVFGSEVTAEMTAVPLVQSRGRAPAPAEVQGLLSAGGEALRVVAVEEGAAELVVVLDGSARLGLGGLGLALDRGKSRVVGGGAAGVTGPAPRLAPRDRLRFVGTRASRLAAREVPFDLFPVSQPFSAAEGSLDFLLTHVSLPEPEGEPRISDAVAAAGVQAAAGNRPRAVVLVVGEDHADAASRFEAAAVRAYLRELRVPFQVWSTGRAQSRRVSEDRQPLSTPTAWGPARDVSSLPRLQTALAELRRRLDDQFVAWVEGSLLPGAVELDPEARGLELAR
jgi:hypothetical protein